MLEAFGSKNNSVINYQVDLQAVHPMVLDGLVQSEKFSILFHMLHRRHAIFGMQLKKFINNHSIFLLSC